MDRDRPVTEFAAYIDMLCALLTQYPDASRTLTRHVDHTHELEANNLTFAAKWLATTL